jgi:hypothetical protein
MLIVIIVCAVYAYRSIAPKKSGSAKKSKDRAKFSWDKQLPAFSFLALEDDDTPDHYSVGKHDHVTSTALGKSSRLEQLETLKRAGLLEEQEYRKKKQEILKER